MKGQAPTELGSAISVRLNRETRVVIADPQHTSVTCTEGTLWITQTADLRDYVLTPGASMAVPRKRALVITAVLGAAACLLFSIAGRRYSVIRIGDLHVVR